jgi:hypothetical protein
MSEIAVNVDADAARNLDDPARHRSLDRISGQPRWIGWNCGDEQGGFLTEVTPDSAEQIYLSREQLEWLRDVGLPAWLSRGRGAPIPVR